MSIERAIGRIRIAVVRCPWSKKDFEALRPDEFDRLLAKVNPNREQPNVE